MDMVSDVPSVVLKVRDSICLASLMPDLLASLCDFAPDLLVTIRVDAGADFAMAKLEAASLARLDCLRSLRVCTMAAQRS